MAERVEGTVSTAVIGDARTTVGTGLRQTSDIEREGLPPPRAVSRSRHRRFVIATVVTDLVVIGGVYLTLRLTGESPRPIVELASIPLWAATLAAYGMYDRRRIATPSEEARRLFQGVSVGVVLVIVGSYLFGLHIPRSWAGAAWLTMLSCLAVERLLVRRVLHGLYRSGRLGTRVLIVGTNREARSIARALDRQPWWGYRLAGFVAPPTGGRDTFAEGPVVADVTEIEAAVGATDAGAVIIASTSLGPGDIAAIERSLHPLGVEIRVSPGLPNVGASRLLMTPIDGLALFSLREHRFSRRQARAKRAIDIALAAVTLGVAAPVMLLIALLVLVLDGRPVFFAQDRAGLNGHPFRMLKFRTMQPDAESVLLDLTDANEADGVLFKMRSDPRVTRLGRFLRPTALDELPQLVNVLLGDMSIVGPRPALLSEADRYDDEMRMRLQVKPGLTGLWQVNGRHVLPFDDYIRYDLFYVENWSVMLDLYVIARTVPAVLTRRGSY